MCTLVYCFLDSKNLDYLKRIYSQCFASSQQLGHCHANVQFQFRDNFKTGAVRCSYNNVHITYLFCRDVFVLERPPYLALLCACEMWDMADINIKCAWQHNHPAQSSVHIVYSCSVLCVVLCDLVEPYWMEPFLFGENLILPISASSQTGVVKIGQNVITTHKRALERTYIFISAEC